MASGARATTVNSSGGSRSRPSADLSELGPLLHAPSGMSSPATAMRASVRASDTDGFTVRLITLFGTPEQAVNQHQRDADADRRVGRVEGGEVPGAEVEVEKVDDRPVAQAVDDVADGAADDEAD